MQGIAGGFEFPVVSAEAILESKVILFLAGENSYASKFTNAELTFAFNEKPKNSILPYIIDGSTMPPALRFVFSSINCRTIDSHPIDITLVEDILRMLRREVKPTPAIGVATQPSVEPREARNIEREDLYDVVLYDVGTATELMTVKIIIDATGLGVDDSKALADSVPVVILRGVSKDRVEECTQEFVDNGAIAECRKCEVKRY